MVIDIAIVDFADRDMVGSAAVLAPLQTADIDFDADAEVDADLADKISEILQSEVGIGTAVAQAAKAAPAADQLVHAQVLELPPVAQVDVFVPVVGAPEQLPKQV